MDDKPAIEYHPFGTITLNFDDGPVKLRRCRLGDLEYAKNLLEEIRSERADQRQAWVDEVADMQTAVPDPAATTEAERVEFYRDLSDEKRAELVAKGERLNEINKLLNIERINVVYSWLSQVAERMGDLNPPAKDEWPLDLAAASIPNDVIDHWQSRPLASGKTLGQNRTLSEISNSGPPVPVASSPQEPLQQ